MLHTLCRGKLHRLRVTHCDLDYVGSLTLDRLLMEAVGLHPYEMVQITNLHNGDLWSTYVLPGTAGSGIVGMNGTAARHFQKGDLIIVLVLAHVSTEELPGFVPKVVFVDEQNRVTRVQTGITPSI